MLAGQAQPQAAHPFRERTSGRIGAERAQHGQVVALDQEQHRALERLRDQVHQIERDGGRDQPRAELAEYAAQPRDTGVRVRLDPRALSGHTASGPPQIAT